MVMETSSPPTPQRPNPSETNPPPPTREGAILFTCWESHVLRLRPSDLQDPERYRQRLAAWLLHQR